MYVFICKSRIDTKYLHFSNLRTLLVHWRREKSARTLFGNPKMPSEIAEQVG